MYSVSRQKIPEKNPPSPEKPLTLSSEVWCWTSRSSGSPLYSDVVQRGKKYDCQVTLHENMMGGGWKWTWMHNENSNQFLCVCVCVYVKSQLDILVWYFLTKVEWGGAVCLQHSPLLHTCLLSFHFQSLLLNFFPYISPSSH